MKTLNENNNTFKILNNIFNKWKKYSNEYIYFQKLLKEYKESDFYDNSIKRDIDYQILSVQSDFGKYIENIIYDTYDVFVHNINYNLLNYLDFDNIYIEKETAKIIVNMIIAAIRHEKTNYEKELYFDMTKEKYVEIKEKYNKESVNIYNEQALFGIKKRLNYLDRKNIIERQYDEFIRREAERNDYKW